MIKVINWAKCDIVILTKFDTKSIQTPKIPNRSETLGQPQKQFPLSHLCLTCTVKNLRSGFLLITLGFTIPYIEDYEHLFWEMCFGFEHSSICLKNISCNLGRTSPDGPSHSHSLKHCANMQSSEAPPEFAVNCCQI